MFSQQSLELVQTFTDFPAVTPGMYWVMSFSLPLVAGQGDSATN
jgi:hypothetical protein